MHSFRVRLWINVRALGCMLWVLASLLGTPSLGRAQNTQEAGRTTGAVYPGATWEKANPQDLGWSTPKLADAHQFFTTLPPASVVVIDHGRVVAEWGDPALRVKLSSVRKSFLSALYGIYVHEGKLDLDKTLEQLGIDDDPRLLPAEKQATLRMTLESRSGVYHPFVGGTPSQLLNMPDRGSHAPGTFWYYNNWDFNVLGTIFEQTLQTKINVAFREQIAGPLQMQDFRLEDMYYQRASANTAAIARSIHPAYHFRLTARDMARFGYLYLRQGKWKDTQVIPADWVKESTTSYSDVGQSGGGGGGGGYGYLWWVNGFRLPVKTFNAWGALGKYIVVIPERDMVVVYQNHTELPDDALAMSDEEVNKLPTISAAQINTLLKMLVDAQR